MVFPPDQSIVLKDGRRLGFAEYGEATGEPTVYLPGSPGNRLNAFLDDWGRESSIRFLSVDRPGYGLSTPHPGRRVADVGDDIAELADHLQLERLSLAGVSGGGPPVLGSAVRLGARVKTSVVVSGVAPPEAPQEGRSPARVKALAAVESNPEKYGRQMGFGLGLARYLPAGLLLKGMASSGTPEADKRLLAQAEVRDILLASTRTMGRRDGLPAALEMQLHNRPWGFDLADIRSHVQLWHGSQDTSVPIAGARYVADQLPDGHLTEVPDAGHLLLFQHWRDIFAGLRAVAERA